MRHFIFTLFAFALAAPAFCGDAKSAKYISEGISFAKHEKYSLAIKRFTSAVKEAPKNSKAYFNRGVAYLKMKDEAAALADFKKACELDNKEGCSVARKLGGKTQPADFSAVTSEALKLEAQEKYEDALSLLDGAIAKAPQTAELYYFKAHVLFNGKKDTGGAVENLDKAVSLKPDYSDAYFLRGLVRKEIKRPGKAIEDFGKAIELSSAPAAFTERGELYILTGKPDEAAADFAKALAVNVEDDRAQTGMGMALKEKGETAEALNYFEKACALKNETACSEAEQLKSAGGGSSLLRAQKEREDGRYDDALKTLGKIISSDPKNYEAWFLKSRILLEDKRDFAEAVESLSKALELKPGSVPALAARISAYKELERYAEAETDAGELIKLSASDCRLYAQRAVLRGLKKDYSASAEDYRQAASLCPKKAEYQFGLATALKNSGNAEKSAEAFAESCELGYKPACVFSRAR